MNLNFTIVLCMELLQKFGNAMRYENYVNGRTNFFLLYAYDIKPTSSHSPFRDIYQVESVHKMDVRNHSVCLFKIIDDFLYMSPMVNLDEFYTLYDPCVNYTHPHPFQPIGLWLQGKRNLIYDSKYFIEPSSYSYDAEFIYLQILQLKRMNRALKKSMRKIHHSMRHVIIARSPYEPPPVI